MLGLVPVALWEVVLLWTVLGSERVCVGVCDGSQGEGLG